MIQLFYRLLKYIVPILICSIFISCTASTHLGKTTIAKPTMEEIDEQVWFQYYQDQFDGKGGKLDSLNNEYPLIAHSAFQKAKLDWDQKVVRKNDQNGIVAMVILGGLVLWLLLTPKKLNLTGSGAFNFN